MRVEVRYLNRLPGIGLDSYAFEAPEGTSVGEFFVDWERGQVVEVVALGSAYDGSVRSLSHKPAQTPGDASTPAPAPPHGARRNGGVL